MSKNAGKVMRLKMPNMVTTPSMVEVSSEEEACLVSRIRSMRTKLQATTRVSIALEKV